MLIPFILSKTNIHILSTAPLDLPFVDEAYQQGIRIDILSFIKTLPILTEDTRKLIEASSTNTLTVIFTSMNAVHAVIEILGDRRPSWNIYCIGQATKKLVVSFPSSSATSSS